MNAEEAFKKYVELGCTEERARELIKRGQEKWWDLMDAEINGKND
jgi:hypothetical protein